LVVPDRPGPGRDRVGRAFHAQARIVVGADGIRSTVAERVGAQCERVGTGASACTYGYWPGLDVDGYEWNFSPDAASGVIPTNDGLACVFASATPARIGRGGTACLIQIVGETDPDLAAALDAAPSRPMRTFTGLPGYVRRSWGPGWALVGDAGYYKDPLSSHGLTDALRDAELLSRAITAVLIDGCDECNALAGYQAARDSLSGALFEVSDIIGGHGWTDAEIGELLLRLNAAMADEVTTLGELPPPAVAAQGSTARATPLDLVTGITASEPLGRACQVVASTRVAATLLPR
jgi:2-polyprenyl-6-methoxyphenol hydroxylase-like FAD-dependent oxidoreductase